MNCCANHNETHKLTSNPRVKDWLYGITPNHPGGDKNTVVKGDYEAEDILSVYHLVNWSKDLGGAGITPGSGKWENVKAIFPLHNPKVNKSFLSYLSRRFFLTPEDIDSIRDLHGSKVQHKLTSFNLRLTYTYRLHSTLPSSKHISCSSPSLPSLESSPGYGFPATPSHTVF